MTVTERTVARPQVKESPRRRTLPPWQPILAWTFGILVVAAAAVLVVLAFLMEGESFEEIYEAESGLALGAIHEPGFEPTTYFVGQSDGTLEEFEARRAAIVAAFGETRDYTQFVPVPVAVPAPPSLSMPAGDATPELCNLQFEVAPLNCLE